MLEYSCGESFYVSLHENKFSPITRRRFISGHSSASSFATDRLIRATPERGKLHVGTRGYTNPKQGEGSEMSMYLPIQHTLNPSVINRKLMLGGANCNPNLSRAHVTITALPLPQKLWKITENMQQCTTTFSASLDYRYSQSSPTS